MQWLEWIAAILSAVSVYLSARENIWSWPSGIVSVAMYGFIFVHAGLYSDAGLQAFFLVISVYGWYEWLHGGANRTRLGVSRATSRIWGVSVLLGLVSWVALGLLTSKLRGVSLPFLDSALTTVSVIAQIMMTRKILENWILWIAVDVVYVPMYVYKGLYPTAALYAVFLGLAVMGLVEWRRSLQRGDATATAEPAPTPA
ncbi:MAG TPA: nicotinamide riboside transporter PnuC [Gemmatimonadaceae bacterium]|nr:nicotinamide riboside transporter PnuC [Gemmatimonadaceae bacterium]